MRHNVITAVLAALLLAGAAHAQVSPQPAAIPNVELPALITNAGQTAATVNSAAQTNTYHRGVICTMNMSAHTNSPSTTIAVQGYDPVSGGYYTLGTSGAVTADATPTSLMIYPGVQTASLAANMTGFGVHLPRRWRVSQVVGGTTPVVTATVGCGMLN